MRPLSRFESKSNMNSAMGPFRQWPWQLPKMEESSGKKVSAGRIEKKKRRSTAHTAYNIASVTKPVTATAIMRLAQERKVGLDVPANEYLKRFQIVSFPGDSRDGQLGNF